MTSSRSRRRLLAIVLLLGAGTAVAPGTSAAAVPPAAASPSAGAAHAVASPSWTPPPAVDSAPPWIWPAAGVVSRAYQQPADAYSAGHRGIDILIDGSTVRAPASGTVLFAGSVVDRPVLTIDHGDGLVSTLEPVRSTLAPGAPVVRGDVIGELAGGGHARPGELHLGARRDGEYINPILLLGEIPRAVLLPCCE